MNALDPVLIASPTQRSGTTLLQRLLCSSANALIYGEFCAHELFMATQLYLVKKTQFSMGQGQRKAQMDQVLEGDVDAWIPDLMPEPNEWLEKIAEGAFLQFEYMKKFAEQRGRPVWGMKMAGWNPHNLNQILGLFPKSRLIYLTRNAEDCLRSAKAIEMIRGEEEESQFLQMWTQNRNIAQQLLPKDRVLFIEFEALVEHPADSIHQLEAFSGAEGIQSEVMQKKINNDGTYVTPV